MIAGNSLSFATSEVSNSLETTEIDLLPSLDNVHLLLFQKDEKDIKPAKLIKKVEPVYPPQAKEEGAEDTIVLEAKVDLEGNVSGIRVLKGEHDFLKTASANAVKQWKFEPMDIDGEPKAVVFTVGAGLNLKIKSRTA